MVLARFPKKLTEVVIEVATQLRGASYGGPVPPMEVRPTGRSYGDPPMAAKPWARALLWRSTGGELKAYDLRRAQEGKRSSRSCP